ncbi:MAG: NADH:flavin oxidoreductase [Anaerovoracaceae bacterium]|jgi:2,4-dienoyl-CoA reductase-like NADH-dependent reductase (Old Yellow Enzyme family)
MNDDDFFFGEDPDRIEKKIFEEERIGSMRLKNRLIRSATCEGLAGEDGSLNDELTEIYRELAQGGAAALITGLAGVSEDDVLIPGCMKLSRDDLVPQYKKLTDEVHKYDCRIIAQIGAGYFVKDGRRIPVDEMSREGIEKIISDFADAAARASEAGFDGIELHAANGYFLSRFYSPYYNHRRDMFGGAADRRARILTDILDAVKKAAPGLTVIAKLNFFDGVEGGVTISDALTACMQLEKHGLDAIEVSASNSSKTDFEVPSEEAYFKDYALALKSISDIPVILEGGNRTIESMQTILDDENADFISLARPLIREPGLPSIWESDSSYKAQCISCNGCYNTPGHRCVFNIEDNK